MARKAKAATNGYDSDALKSYVTRAENLHGDLVTEHSKYMLACKAIRADIKSVLEEANDKHSIPKRELKAVIKTRLIEKKLEAIREDLEPENQETYDQIRFALGDIADLPLGKAVLEPDLQMVDSLSH